MSGLVRLLLALAAGALAAVIGWSLAPTGAPTAVATLRLDDQEVRWPYHDAVIQTQDALVEQDTVRADVANRAGLPLESLIDLDASVPRNQTIFDVTAIAETGDAAVALATAAVDELVERNRLERSAAAATEATTIDADLVRLDQELSTQRRIIDDPEVAEADRLLAQGRATAIAQEIGTLEVRADSARQTADSARPQLVIVRSGELVERERTRTVTAASAGIGVALLAVALLGAFRPRPTRELASVRAA